MYLLRKTLCLAAACVVLSMSVSSVMAASNASPDKTSPAASVNAAKVLPDPNANPILSNLQKIGAKLYFLGNRSGLNGWFILKDGQMQVIYAPADGQSVLIGALFGADGNDITKDQVEALFASNPEVKTALANTAHQAVEAQKAQIVVQAETTASPGEKLYLELSMAHGVMLGTNESAPTILMVFDPGCPHCQATWRKLRDLVSGNLLRVHLIPIGTKDSDNERAAARLLQAADPSDAWNKTVDGDKNALAGTPDKSSIEATQANHLLVDKWKLKEVPVILYRAKDGKIKIEQGEPTQPGALLDDIAAPVSPQPQP